MTATICLTACIISLPLTSAPSFGQDAKFAQISVEKISKKSSRIQKAFDEVNKLRAEAQGRVTALKTAIKMIQTRLEKDAKTLKPEEKKKLEQDLQAKAEEIQNEQQNLRAKISFKQQSLQNVLSNQLSALVDKIAKQDGFTAVFWRRSLAYAAGLPDISEKVAKELDALPAVEKGPQDAPPTKKAPQKKSPQKP